MSEELKSALEVFRLSLLFPEEYQLIKSALECKEKLEIENSELKARNEKLEKDWEIVKDKQVNFEYLFMDLDYKISHPEHDCLKHYNDFGSMKTQSSLTETEFNDLVEILEKK